MSRLSRRKIYNNSGNLALFLEKELTDTQKCYIIMYYRDGITMREIARRCGVQPSTVSRTIKRANDRIERCICAARLLV